MDFVSEYYKVRNHFDFSYKLLSTFTRLPKQHLYGYSISLFRFGFQRNELLPMNEAPYPSTPYNTLRTFLGIFILQIGGWLVLCNGTRFQHLAISPREVSYLEGVFTAALIHWNGTHLLTNLQGFIPSVLLLYYICPRHFAKLYLGLYLASSFVLWMVGRTGLHLGASGLVLALMFFVFGTGLFSFRRQFILLAIGLAIYQVVTIEGLLAPHPQSSLEAHLAGAGVGLVVAYFFWRPFQAVETNPL